MFPREYSICSRFVLVALLVDAPNSIVLWGACNPFWGLHHLLLHFGVEIELHHHVFKLSCAIYFTDSHLFSMTLQHGIGPMFKWVAPSTPAELCWNHRNRARYCWVIASFPFLKFVTPKFWAPKYIRRRKHIDGTQNLLMGVEPSTLTFSRFRHWVSVQE